MNQNKSNTRQNHEIIDGIIVDQIKCHPDKPINQIGNDLKQIGVYKHPVSVYHRLVQSDFIKLELAKLKEKVQESVARELFPIAFKQAKIALKNKDLDEKGKFPYIKLIFDKTLGEDFQGIINQTVNINQLQQVVNQSLSNRE